VKRVNRIEGRALVLKVNDVDTDQIIPARFLKTTSKQGLGECLFHDWRYGPRGEPRPDSPLNDPAARLARILVAGDNFGCGSSREHAVWALLGFGFEAIISSSFGDIFRQNALRNGLLPVIVPRAFLERAVKLVTARPDGVLVVDLAGERVALPDGRSTGFSIDPFARRCLLDGVDEIGYVLQQDAAIAAFERRHPAAIDTRDDGASTLRFLV
jgi:3-isopropylmalate/(R)-2-methylmalate dehydratase small subunit